MGHHSDRMEGGGPVTKTRKNTNTKTGQKKTYKEVGHPCDRMVGGRTLKKTRKNTETKTRSLGSSVMSLL